VERRELLDSLGNAARRARARAPALDREQAMRLVDLEEAERRPAADR
jgi:hypothetical protein